MPNPKSVETFVWVARLGGFRAAAEKLGTTQPSVSHRVGQLEAALGVALFERGPRGTVLTPPGREFLGYAERLMALSAEAVSAVSPSKAIRGLVRLGVAETIVHTWLPALVERLHASYPHVTLEIEVDTTAHLREALLDQSLDVAFLLGPLAEPRIRNVPLSVYPMAWIARPGLALPPPPLAAEALRAWPIITYSRGTRPYMNVREALSAPGEAPPRIHANASLSTIVRMTLDGIGIAAVPPVLMAKEIAAGLLAILATRVALNDLTFTACWLASPDDHGARAIVRLARDTAAAAPYAAER
jgi:DNA-binding transcriptional LysR family regulator